MKKVVLEEAKEGQTLVSAVRDGCDPYTETVDNGLLLATVSVPRIWEAAEARWKDSPTNPKYEPPAPKPAQKPKSKDKAKPSAKSAEATTAPAETPAEAEKPAGTREEFLDKLAAAQEEGKGTPQLPLLNGKPAEKPAEPKHGRIDAEQIIREASEAEDAEEAARAQRTPAEPVKNQPTPAGKGTGKLFLATGEGPFDGVQAALDALGLPKDKRPNHNRYDRLSRELKTKIVVK